MIHFKALKFVRGYALMGFVIRLSPNSLVDFREVYATVNMLLVLCCKTQTDKEPIKSYEALHHRSIIMIFLQNRTRLTTY